MKNLSPMIFSKEKRDLGRQTLSQILDAATLHASGDQIQFIRIKLTLLALLIEDSNWLAVRRLGTSHDKLEEFAGSTFYNELSREEYRDYSERARIHRDTVSKKHLREKLKNKLKERIGERIREMLREQNRCAGNK
ncbi:hypothetical protein GUITHDRAFT_122398 [Guillardia theta CCMP2712]|uniref:Uncharacterized protein n=1 Tax=Guillardia theta (strain CCMP2712) TaxID=905079 RepID=L1I6A3_GUITC|nr:hypothetical protein GUITHDRAFT_122398 [Guillardia theta CCMP2712]EKX31409.1 hypothetical protein GUITHDRAFT_122398 [Guillardia theta CCMP2712]|eukprot:XP_005818389.1 hypothetical protein GUITHDRAFT_122398 [Guillardia theta CCMP2712]